MKDEKETPEQIIVQSGRHCVLWGDEVIEKGPKKDVVIGTRWAGDD